jgi:hypothetical protein
MAVSAWGQLQARNLRAPAFAGATDQDYRSRRVGLAQLFNDDQMLRERRKRSTGVDDPSASKRCSSTPLH